MGLNLYGYDYSSSEGRKDIIGDTFISITMQNSLVTNWSESDRENHFSYTKNGIKHTMYYPTLLVMDNF